MEERVHPIPFRTRQLSSPSSMILRILTWESRTTPRLYFQRAVFVRRPVVFLPCRHSRIPSAIPNQAPSPFPVFLLSLALPPPRLPSRFFPAPTRSSSLPGFRAFSLSLSLSPSNGPAPLPVTSPLSLFVPRRFQCNAFKKPLPWGVISFLKGCVIDFP